MTSARDLNNCPRRSGDNRGCLLVCKDLKRMQPFWINEQVSWGIWTVISGSAGRRKMNRLIIHKVQVSHVNSFQPGPLNNNYSCYRSHAPSRAKRLDEKLSFYGCQSSPPLYRKRQNSMVCYLSPNPQNIIFKTSSVRIHSTWQNEPIWWVRNSELNSFLCGNHVLIITAFLSEAAVLQTFETVRFSVFPKGNCYSNKIRYFICLYTWIIFSHYSLLKI